MMKHARTSGWGVAFGGALWLSSSALLWAQSAAAEPPHTPALDSATERFETGKRLFRQGTKEHNATKLERAYFEFKAAYAIYPAHGTLLNLIETELSTGRGVEAMKHVREYARTYGVPDEGSEYHRTFVTQESAAFNATGHIDLVAPSGMRVVVDGKDAEVVTPLRDPLDVTPGHHVVELLGGETLRGEAEAAAGATTTLAFTVAQAAGGAAGSTTAFSSTSSNASPSSLASPLPPSSTGAAGGNLGSSSSAGMGSTSSSAGLPPDVVSPSASAPFWTSTRVAGALVGVTGLISLGAGVGFSVLANQDADRATSVANGLGPSGCIGVPSPACHDLQSAHDDQLRDHALNLVFVGIGAAATIAGAALMLWPTRSSHSVAIVPAVSPLGGGLSLSVRGEL